MSSFSEQQKLAYDIVHHHLELRMKYAQIDFSNTGQDGLWLKPT